MKKLSLSRLLNLIDRIEHEEIRFLCENKKYCECKEKKERENCSSKQKREVR